MVTISGFDIAAGDQTYAVIPYRGRLLRVDTVTTREQVVDDAILTVKVDGTALTNGSITVAADGGVGDTDNCSPSGIEANFEPGGRIEIETDRGGAGGVVNATLLIGAQQR